MAGTEGSPPSFRRRAPGRSFTVVFDLNGTLIDTSALAEPLGDDREARLLVASAMNLAITHGMAVSLTGAFIPFDELVEAALRQRLEAGFRETDGIASAMELISRLPPFPDSAQAIDALVASGHRLVVLTNSSTRDGVAVLEHAGLIDRFEAVFGADQVSAYKPHPLAYRYALRSLDVAPADAWLIAAHWWDVWGAARAGLRTAWVAHSEHAMIETIAPDVVGESLTAAATEIVDRTLRVGS